MAMIAIELLEHRIAPATFIVTTFADSGEGSLRDAISDANANPGRDLIVFERGLTGTIAITSGVMMITDTLKIKGPGAAKMALDANLQSRFFLVNDSDEAKDSTLSISGLSFFQGAERGNIGAGQRGGAIASVESLNIKGCVFANNEAPEASGGAIAIQQIPEGVSVSLDVRTSRFRSNSAGAFGSGAIFANVEGSITLKSNVFADNFAETLGGAASLRQGTRKTLLVQDCEFLGNRADEGGALFIAAAKDGIVIIRDSLFAGNEASVRNGGAAVISGANVLIEGSTFIQNVAQTQGGGLDVTATSSLVFRSSQFFGNTAVEPASGGGGLEITVPEIGNARIIGSIISGNNAIQGGGIQVTGTPGELQVIRSLITGNSAATSGGGILVLKDSMTCESADLKIIRSEIIGNVAETGNGGGVAMAGDGEFSIVFSRVIQNFAGANGGGLSLSGGALASIIGSIIAQNKAGEQGGGIFTASPLDVSLTRILGNSATEGGGIRAFSDLSLDLSLVSANSATIGGGILHALGADLSLHRSRVVRNFSLDGGQIVEV